MPSQADSIAATPRLAPEIATGLARVATVAAAHTGDAAALIDAIIALLTDSLHVGLLHLTRLDGETLHYDRVVDTAGMGLPEGVAVPLIETYCAMLLADATPDLVIADARADPRVADHTATRLLGIGAYSGVPLYRSDGRIYGTLCTLHPTPREVPEGEVALLRLAGRVIMQAIETLTCGEEALRASEERFRALTEHATDLVSIVTPDGAVTYSSPSHLRILGTTPAQEEGMDAFTLIHPDDLAQARAAFAGALARPGLTPSVVFRRRAVDGTWRWLEMIGNNRLDDPAIRGVIVNSRDITESVRAMEALRSGEAALADAQHLAHLGSWEQDIASGAMRWSDEAYRLLGYAPGSVVPTPERFRAALHPEDRARVITTLGETRATGAASRITCRVVTLDGVTRVLQVEARLQRDETGAPRRLVGAALDVTERQHLEEALRHQALHDALTGLPNRTLLDDRLAQAILAATRTGRPLALLLLDLDRFKEVNDTLGHHAGDLLLQGVAERLRGVVRATDTVARLGGDEFAVLVPTMDDTGALPAAQKLLAALEAPIEVEGQPLQVGVSVGIALCPAHGTDAQTLLRRADVALYVAKRARGGVALYAPAQDAHNADRLALAAALRPAIAHGDLVLHYQPVVALATGRVRGVEALARWRHPEAGLVPPDEFIPLAEQTGQMEALTCWVLEEALRQGQAWRRAGRVLTMQVNLSMVNLHDPQFPATLQELLARYETPPEELCLELTESVVMADAARALAVLTRLAGQGIRIAVDDFGTGYSSLAYLKRLPVHELKIDRAFVRDLATDEADAAIVASTIGLGHALGLLVVAEGIEDQTAWERLAGLGCDLAQGYYLSRPVPPDELERWLDTREGRLSAPGAAVTLSPAAIVSGLPRPLGQNRRRVG